MRQRNARTLGGLVIVVVAVLVAAWLLSAGESEATGGPAGAGRDDAGVPALQGDAAQRAAAAREEQAPQSLSALAGAAPAGDAATQLFGEPLQITGRVVDAEGRPIEAALVLHWPTQTYRTMTDVGRQPGWDGVDWTRLASTRTGPDGRFALATRDEPQERLHELEVEGGALSSYPDEDAFRPALFVEHAGFATNLVPVLGARGGAADVGDIVLPAEATISGQVVDADGQPVPALRFAVLDFAPSTTAARMESDLFDLRTAQLTGPDGALRLTGLSAGTMRLHAEPAGLEPFEREITLIAGEHLDLGDVLLGRGGRIEGHVVGPDGRPVAGARVRAAFDPGLVDARGPDRPAILWQMRLRAGGRFLNQDAVADGDGAFVLGGLWSELKDFCVLASAPGFDPAAEEHVIAGTGELLLQLQPQAAWQLSVVDAAGGAPVAGAVVTAWRKPNDSEDWSASCEVEAGEGGLLVRGAGRDRTRLTTTAPGHMPKVDDLPGLQAGETREFTVKLAPGLEIVGHVLDEKGAPLARAVVRLDAPSGLPLGTRSPNVIAATDGGFRFGEIAPGTWKLSARASGCLPVIQPVEVQVEADTPPAPVDLVLPRGGEVTGTLLDVDGAPVAAALVFAATEDPATLSQALAVGASGRPAPSQPPTALRDYVRTDRDGSFRFGSLAPGAWTLDGGEDAKASVTVVSRQSVQVTLARVHPPPPPRLRGRVTLGGQPAADVAVELGEGPWSFKYDDDVWATTRTGPDGSFDLVAPRPGTCMVRARDELGASPAQRVELAWDRVDYLDLELPGGSIAGRVVLRGTNAPVRGVKVRLTAPHAPGEYSRPTEVTSGDDGGFRFGRVAEGEWHVVAGSENYVETPDLAVRVEGGRPVPDLTLVVEVGGTIDIMLASAAEWTSTFAALTAADGQAEVARAPSRPDGSVHLGPVPPGEYRVTIEHREGDATVVERTGHATVVAGQALRLGPTLDG